MYFWGCWFHSLGRKNCPSTQASVTVTLVLVKIDTCHISLFLVSYPANKFRWKHLYYKKCIEYEYKKCSCSKNVRAPLSCMILLVFNWRVHRPALTAHKMGLKQQSPTFFVPQNRVMEELIFCPCWWWQVKK